MLSDIRDGIPIIAPELQLPYKSRVLNRPKDDVDLCRMIPWLTNRRTAWLRVSMARPDPDSPYLELLLPLRPAAAAASQGQTWHPKSGIHTYTREGRPWCPTGKIPTANARREQRPAGSIRRDSRS